MRPGAAAPVSFFAALLSLGCGGGAPLMHSAYPTPEHEVAFGAGFSGTLLARQEESSGAASDFTALRDGALGPGLAPFVGARYGFGSGYDAGLAYTGRSVRLDGRKSLLLPHALALSLGLGVSGVLPEQRKDAGLRVGGVGGDVPILIGWSSRPQVFELWLGARAGGEILRGQLELPADPASPGTLTVDPLSGWHAFAGGVAGVRIGYRSLFALFELDAAMNWAKGDIGGAPVSLGIASVAPAGALVGRF